MKIQIDRQAIKSLVLRRQLIHERFDQNEQAQELARIIKALEASPVDLVELDNADIQRYFEPLPGFHSPN